MVRWLEFVPVLISCFDMCAAFLMQYCINLTHYFVVPHRPARTAGGRRAGGRNRLNAAALVLGVVYDHDS